SMYNITVENMDLESTSAAIKVSSFEANSTGDMYNMIFRIIILRELIKSIPSLFDQRRSSIIVTLSKRTLSLSTTVTVHNEEFVIVIFVNTIE
ncbi:unnamed protein product, partial [Rotaria sp. Silwood2]